MLLSKCGLGIEAMVCSFVVGTIAIGASGAPIFVGGGTGPTFDTRPAVAITDHSGQATSREVDYIITGHGMTSMITDSNGGALGDGSPVGRMGLFRGHTHANPGTVAGSHWGRFQFDQPYDLSNLWVWNWNESTVPDPNPNDPSYPTVGSTRFGWKYLTVEYSMTGGPNPAEWSVAGVAGTLVPRSHNGSQTGGVTDGAVDLVMDLGGITAQYVVLTNVGFGADENWSNGAFTNDAGLSEVRFEIVPEPASLGLLSLAAIALVRRRK